MYRYILKLYLNDDSFFELEFSAFDYIDALNIVDFVVSNRTNLSSYSLFSVDYKRLFNK